MRNPSASSINTITAPKEGWNVRDPNTAIVFVVDTGFPHSLFTCTCTRPTSVHRYSGASLAANGSKIPTFERKQLHLTLGLGKSFTWDFMKAGVERAILGMGFLEHFDVLLDTRQRKFVPGENILGEESTALPREETSDPEITPKADCSQAKQGSSLHELFDLYPSLFDVENFNRPVRHQQNITSGLRDPLVAQKVRRLRPEKGKLKKEIQRLLELGVLIPAESPIGAPVHMVAKKQPGEYRITGDFRLLN